MPQGRAHVRISFLYPPRPRFARARLRSLASAHRQAQLQVPLRRVFDLRWQLRLATVPCTLLCLFSRRQRIAKLAGGECCRQSRGAGEVPGRCRLGARWRWGKSVLLSEVSQAGRWLLCLLAASCCDRLQNRVNSQEGACGPLAQSNVVRGAQPLCDRKRQRQTAAWLGTSGLGATRATQSFELPNDELSRSVAASGGQACQPLEWSWLRLLCTVSPGEAPAAQCQLLITWLAHI